LPTSPIGTQVNITADLKAVFNFTKADAAGQIIQNCMSLVYFVKKTNILNHKLFIADIF